MHRYRFDPEQSYRLKEGDSPVNPATGRSAGTIVRLDALKGTLDLSWEAKDERPHPTSLIPQGPRNTDPQRGALETLGAWVADHGIAGEGPWRAARDFLMGEHPRAGQAADAPVLPPADPIQEAAREVVRRLDESVLPVQGPPGSGKTYIGAEMILLAGGRREEGRHRRLHPSGPDQPAERGPGARRQSGRACRGHPQARIEREARRFVALPVGHETTRRWPTRSANTACTSRRAPAGCGHATSSSGASTPSSSTRPGRCRWPT